MPMKGLKDVCLIVFHWYFLWLVEIWVKIDVFSIVIMKNSQLQMPTFKLRIFKITLS